MKRFTSLLLTALMLLSLTDCGGETVPPPRRVKAPAA